MPRKQGDYRTRIWKFEDGLSNVLVIQLNKLIICVMCLVRDCDVLEVVFPPVIGVAAHKGGVYKTSVSVHLAQDLALKGLRVLLVEG